MVVGALMKQFLVGVVGLRGWSHGVPCSYLLLMGWKVFGQCSGRCALWLGIGRGEWTGGKFENQRNKSWKFEDYIRAMAANDDMLFHGLHLKR
jgi:hypothetical protein